MRFRTGSGAYQQVPGHQGTVNFEQPAYVLHETKEPEDWRMSFATVLQEAARGNLPAPDDRIEVLGEDPGRAFAVLAFPAHFYVLAPVEPEWVSEFLRPGDYGAPLGARFLTALGGRLEAGIGPVDALLSTCAHLSAGYVPVAAEVLLPRGETGDVN